MSSIADQIKAKTRAAIQEDPYMLLSKSTRDLARQVHMSIKSGHREGGQLLYGATDIELGKTFANEDRNKLRWVRYNLVQMGLVQDSGKKRGTLGKPKATVWESTPDGVQTRAVKKKHTTKKMQEALEKINELATKWHKDSIATQQALCDIAALSEEFVGEKMLIPMTEDDAPVHIEAINEDDILDVT